MCNMIGFYNRTGSLQQLQRNIAAAKQLVAADLGIRVSNEQCMYAVAWTGFCFNILLLVITITVILVHDMIWLISSQDHLIPPGVQAIEEAQKLFDQMQRVHSAFSKIELLLQAVRITYDNVSQCFTIFGHVLKFYHTTVVTIISINWSHVKQTYQCLLWF